MRRNFDSFSLSLTDKVATGKYNFLSLIVKIILLALLLLLISFSLPATKIQYLAHLSFNSTLQLINGISSDLKLLQYFNGTEIVAFFSIPLAPPANVFPINLALYVKYLKSLVLLISVLKLVTSIFE